MIEPFVCIAFRPSDPPAVSQPGGSGPEPEAGQGEQVEKRHQQQAQVRSTDRTFSSDRFFFQNSFWQWMSGVLLISTWMCVCITFSFQLLTKGPYYMVYINVISNEIKCGKLFIELEFLFSPLYFEWLIHSFCGVQVLLSVLSRIFQYKRNFLAAKWLPLEKNRKHNPGTLSYFSVSGRGKIYVAWVRETPKMFLTPLTLQLGVTLGFRTKTLPLSEQHVDSWFLFYNQAGTVRESTSKKLPAETNNDKGEFMVEKIGARVLFWGQSVSMDTV